MRRRAPKPCSTNKPISGPETCAAEPSLTATCAAKELADAQAHTELR